uniref:Jacalin-type lectin domain-containing protein n=1 Tax=Tanacetum cinerariifolium TaxID=118510 RepID=A0A699QWU6_TANCI|nr:hypothetical protein [Tanacetum cinerariifolium]
MVATEVRVGPWGGDGGEHRMEFKIKDGWELKKITVVSTKNGCVHSIEFIYLDDDNNLQHKKYGGDAPSDATPETLIIKDGKKITAIGGTVGSYEVYTVITSLRFKVGNDDYKTFGTPRGTPFLLPVSLGDVSGFFGHYGGDLDSMGVIISPS